MTITRLWLPPEAPICWVPAVGTSWPLLKVVAACTAMAVCLALLWGRGSACS